MRAYPSAWHLQEIDNLCVLGIKNPDIAASPLSIPIFPCYCLYLILDVWFLSSLFYATKQVKEEHIICSSGLREGIVC